MNKKNIKIIVLSSLILILIFVLFFIPKEKKESIQITHYYTKNNFIQENILVSSPLSFSKKMNKMVNQILLGAKNNLKRGGQNKGTRCLEIFFIQDTLFLFMNKNFILLSQKEHSRILKSIVATLQNFTLKTRNPKIVKYQNIKNIKITVNGYQQIDREDKEQNLNLNQSISFQQILSQ